jgi:hypothetical protein
VRIGVVLARRVRGGGGESGRVEEVLVRSHAEGSRASHLWFQYVTASVGSAWIHSQGRGCAPFGELAEVEESSRESSSSSRSSLSRLVVQVTEEVVHTCSPPDQHLSIHSDTSVELTWDHRTPPAKVSSFVPPLAQPAPLLLCALQEPLLEGLDERGRLELLDSGEGRGVRGQRGGRVGRRGSDMERLYRLDVACGRLLERRDGEVRQRALETVYRSSQGPVSAASGEDGAAIYTLFPQTYLQQGQSRQRTWLSWRTCCGRGAGEGRWRT